ncbi:MAG: ATP-binding protein [Candidatus Lokiarchaeota archaeon]
MEFFSKKLEDIDFSDVQSLVDNEIPESYDLDYKEDYPKGNVLPKLMIGLSNATGGFIIIGIKCKPNTNIPDFICGVGKGEHKNRVTSMAYANSQPKIWPKVQVIEHKQDSTKDLVIIKVNEANEPIMFTQGNKFPIRINDKIEYADQPLIKKLFSKKNLKERIEQELHEIHNSQKNEFLDKIRSDPANRYISINFISFPFHRGKILININDKEVEKLIQSLYNKITHRLYERLISFDNYIRDFNYMGNYFDAKFVKSNKEKKIFSNFKIFETGKIVCSLSYLARKGEDLKSSLDGNYDEIKIDKTTAYHSAYLNDKNAVALIVLFLYLSKLIYKDRFEGKLYTSFRFLTRDYKIFMETGQGYYDYSNTNDFDIEKTIYTRDLGERSSYETIVEGCLRNFLRYFGYNLGDLDKMTIIFKSTLNWYLDSLFKKKK